MERQQLNERIEYNYDDKMFILEKTQYHCAHCGKKIGVSKCTIDHFIPISKGGTNRKINLVPLCLDCNSKKRNKIVAPDWYLPYMEKTKREELNDYFQSYIHSFEYLSRGNLLSCDMYQISVYTGPFLQSKNKKNCMRVLNTARTSFILERIYPDEAKEATSFYIRALQKYGRCDSEESARQNIEFWLTFGVIYAIRDTKTNDIRLLVPIVMGQDRNGEGALWAHIFACYSNMTTSRLVDRIPFFFADKIIEEQGLKRLHIVVNVLPNDPAAQFFLSRYEWVRDGFFKQAGGDYVTLSDGKNESQLYSNNFNEIEKRLNQFFDRPGYEGISWMAGSVLEKYCDSEFPVYVYPERYHASHQNSSSPDRK